MLVLAQHGWTGLLFAFLIGHALADFPLQGEFASKAKCPSYWKKHPRSNGFEWIFVLLAHCLIHGGIVWLITGSQLLGAIELVLHLIIDKLKCLDKTSFTTDQILHILCKVGYLLILSA